jgi:hypothetical protein
MDHHPEWALTNGGCSVNVTLTSHFAGNKVTRLDFELAEAMNDEFTVVNNTYQMFPLINSKKWVSIRIAVGMLVGGFVFFRFVVGPEHELKPQKHYATKPIPEYPI